MRSLQTKITVVLAACLLATVVAMFVSSSVFMGDVVNQNSNLTSELSTRELSEDIDKRMLAVQQSTDAMAQYCNNLLAANPEQLKTAQGVQSYLSITKTYALNESRNTYGAISSYFVLNPEIYGYGTGFFLTRLGLDKDFSDEVLTDLSAYPPDDVEHVGWYYVPVQQGKPTWMQPYQNKNIDVWMISYVIPLHTAEGELLGVIGMDLDFSPIIDSIAEGYIYSENGSAMLFNSDGMLLYRKGYDVSDPQPSDPVQLEKLHASVDESLLNDASVDADWGEGRYRVFARKLTNGMTLAATVPAADMMVPLLNQLAVSASIALIILAVALAASFLLARSITRPVRGLSQAAAEIAAGNMDVRIDLPKTDDEVGTLAEAFKSMASELHVRMDHMSLMAFVDSLTGLGSRAAYMSTVETLDPEIKRGTADFTFILLDVNYLKVANDVHGHEAGDALLQDAASICLDIFGKGHVFRFGGDEYAAIIPGSMHVPEEHWVAALEALVEAFNTLHEDGQGNSTRPYGSPLSLAWGVVAFDPSKYSSVQDVFEEADRRMYECKKHQKSLREQWERPGPSSR